MSSHRKSPRKIIQVWPQAEAEKEEFEYFDRSPQMAAVAAEIAQARELIAAEQAEREAEREARRVRRAIQEAEWAARKAQMEAARVKAERSARRAKARLRKRAQEQRDALREIQKTWHLSEDEERLLAVLARRPAWRLADGERLDPPLSAPAQRGVMLRLGRKHMIEGSYRSREGTRLTSKGWAVVNQFQELADVLAGLTMVDQYLEVADLLIGLEGGADQEKGS